MAIRRGKWAERIVPLAAILAVTASCGLARQDRYPSIVLISVDTLRADHLGCYGYFRNTSPTLDRFAQEGVLFENALTPMATTLPAHASLLTSVSPQTHGIRANFDVLGRRFEGRGGLRSFAQILDDLGYETAAFVSATPLKTHTGIQSGFLTFDEPEGIERGAEQTTDQARAWLGTRAGDPFFLWVHYFDPHDPYEPPPEYRELFETDEQLLNFLRVRRAQAWNPEILRVNNLYDGEIRYFDDQLGRLFEALKEHADWQSLAIVVVGDHGEALGQHGWLDHGRIYHEQLRVPLILKLPGPRPETAVRYPGLAALVDVIPTLVGALNLPIPVADAERFEGVDLLTAPQSRRFALAERVDNPRRWEPGPKYALTTEQWKYFFLPLGRDSLYSMKEDPYELQDVIDQEPEVAARMKAKILDILAQGTTDSSEEEAALPAEVIEELRSLGYVE